jgi:hypothetical protein
MSRKLSHFLYERVFFKPLSHEQATEYIEILMRQKKVAFTITELSMFGKICEQLSVDSL